MICSWNSVFLYASTKGTGKSYWGRNYSCGTNTSVPLSPTIEQQRFHVKPKKDGVSGNILLLHFAVSIILKKKKSSK
jgi:hypothetical protein